ncbi:MAG TPA: malectin domain-containing carbohydrate-binding protein, partial [Lunatimonas sp.]|nr:malectin domain-containing carbohydrate-binding protein [Lunatimonas sp.]
ERFGREFIISVPVPNGTYTVKTYHNELWFGHGGRQAKAGQRVYDISLQNKTERERFDLFSENKNLPLELVFKNVTVSNGRLELGMKAHANNASISGLAITRESTEPTTDQPNTASFLRLKTGHATDIEHNGATFESDFKFKGYYGESNTFGNSMASDEELYQTERNGVSLNYSIPIPNGIYTVKTHHNELYFGHTGPSAIAGRRVFDIALENKTVKKEFDLFVENQNRPTVLTFEQVVVTDGILNIDMVATRYRATVSAISIYENVGDLNNDIEEQFTWSLNTGGKFDELFNEIVFIGEGSTTEIFHNLSSWTYSNRLAADEGLFRTERNSGQLTYRIPIPNGSYTVYTMHNELYFGHTGPSAIAGRRVFDISIEGELVKKDFDIFVENGNKPTVLEFRDIQVSDGFLDLEMRASRNRATVSGIAIRGNATGTTLQGANLRVYMDTVDTISKTGKLVTEEKIKVYPNPANGKVTVELNTDITEGSILIHSMGGQLIRHFNLSGLRADNNKYMVPLDNISQGAYLISVFEKQEVIKRMRLMVTPSK